MKKFMKVLTLMLVVATLAALCVASFAGCNNDKDKDKNLLTVATEAKFKPFEYMDDNGNYVGFDMELAEALAKKLGYDGIKVENLEFDAIIASVQGDKEKDTIGIAAMTINPERLDAVAFSKPYLAEAYQVIVVDKNNTKFDNMTKEQILASLTDSTIYYAQGQTGQFFALGNEKMNFPGINCKKAEVCQDATTVFASITNNSQVGLVDNLVANEYCSKNANLKYIDVPLTYENYGIAIHKDNKKLKTKIDKALDELVADKTVEKLLTKYGISAAK